MTIITISKELAKNKDLIAIPKTTFEEFLIWQRKTKSSKKFKPTLSEKKILIKARKNFIKRKFVSITELRHELGRRRR